MSMPVDECFRYTTMRPPRGLGVDYKDPRRAGTPGPKYAIVRNLTATGSQMGLSYSFGSRIKSANDNKTVSPGPKYTIVRNLTATGSQMGLSYSFGSRIKIPTGSGGSIPGPKYNVRSDPYRVSPSTSGCTFGVRT